jgi:hypothetical protein
LRQSDPQILALSSEYGRCFKKGRLCDGLLKPTKRHWMQVYQM